MTFGDPANLRANNDSDPTNNLGQACMAISGEVAFHIPMGTILNSEWEAVPFYRYTYQNFQTAGLPEPTPTCRPARTNQFHNIGVAVFPSPKIVLKATYQKVINKRSGGSEFRILFSAASGFFF